MNMLDKKYESALTICITILIVCLSSCSNMTPNINRSEKGKSLPAIQLLLADSTTIVNTIDEGVEKPTMLIYFSPNCLYCKAQMNEITKHINDLKNVSLYAMTTSPYKDMMRFYNESKLKKYEKIKMGVDYQNTFAKHFNVPGFPFIAIFNKEKKLNGTFLGKTPMNKLKQGLIL